MKNYKAVGKIGEGTFSEVMKVQSLRDGNYYACKQMKQHFESIEQVNNLREIQALRRLNPHPNILMLHEVVFDRKSGSLALICELMDMNIYELIRGHTERDVLWKAFRSRSCSCNEKTLMLKMLVKSSEKIVSMKWESGQEHWRRHPLSEKKIMRYMYQLCTSLDHMHRNGIFHRDVKPENILIKQDVLKLGDFGSCRSVYSKQPYTEYISTRWYRAPECLLTDGFYTYKMDLWSAGCVFYEITSLQPLFPGANELDQISKIHEVIGTPAEKTLTKFKQATEKQSLTSHRKAFLPERPVAPQLLSNNWQISKEGRKQKQSIKQEEDHPKRQGPACLMELPKLKFSGVTKLSSYSSPALQSAFGPGASGTVPVLRPLKCVGTNPKTDTQKDIKPNLRQCRLPTIGRKAGGY
ncbi:MAPK/MAK/MRK overlapping kinase isoform X6 [Equus caballus]|uniref:MAPK/MAK/MRK overlapping kinase isoform X6 n=1 Tax=Equus caballus TaxID=9796 RepID=UPI000C9DFFB3|nr:MAPK/MAK/MRK overlapping kinase isoform X6 [Equus caballus]